jgi:competence protein ComEC
MNISLKSPIKFRLVRTKSQFKNSEFLEKFLRKTLKQLWYNKKVPMRYKLGAFALVLLIISTVFVVAYFHTENSRQFLTVAFLDVGQGDSIFIEAPNGNQLLIDSGPTAGVVRRLSEVMPFYDRSIDTILATHHDADHTAGFPEILKRFKIDTYIVTPKTDDDSLYNEIENLISTEVRSDGGIGVEKLIAAAGDKIILDEENEIYIEILWPPDVESGVVIGDNNESSVATRVVYGEIEFMLTGDLGKESEDKIVSAVQLAGRDIESDVLKAGHHGSKTSTSVTFVAEVAPRYAVISAGKDNKFGHPHEEVLQTLNDYAIATKIDLQILSTAELGNIIFQSDGSEIWVK